MTINHWILGGTRYSDRTSWAKNPDSHWHLGQATGWILRKGFRLPQCFPQHWRKKLLWNTTPWPERMVCQPPKIMVCQPPNLRYNWYQSGIYIYIYIHTWYNCYQSDKTDINISANNWVVPRAWCGTRIANDQASKSSHQSSSTKAQDHELLKGT